MQPYIFPYLGYFQLICAVDKFVLLDDVHYINRGWINRNRLFVNERIFYFTIPLDKASQNRLIRDIKVAIGFKWKEKLLKTLACSYRRAPFYKEISSLVKEVLDEDQRYISRVVLVSLRKILKYLDIHTNIVAGSAIYANQHLKAQDKILDICRQENAGQYVNPAGGIELYNSDVFQIHGIELHGLKPNLPEYKHPSGRFIPGLSIIDVLMYNDPETTREMLGKYSLQYIPSRCSLSKT
ncbi:MAG: WbqC family protein [Balneolales bacterium]